MAAGSHAKRRSAYTEAISHYRQSLELLSDLATKYPMEERNIELQIQIPLAGCYIATQGYSADQVQHTYERAEKLSSELGAADQLLQARIGLESFHFMRANFERAYELGQLCLTMLSKYAPLPGAVNAESDPRQSQRVMALSQAHWALANVLFHQGEFDLAMPQMEQCIILCNAISPRPRRLLQDPEIMCRVYQAWYTWEAGYPDQALQKVNTAVELAREFGHPFSLGVALGFCACIHLFRREYDSVIANAGESIKLCE